MALSNNILKSLLLFKDLSFLHLVLRGFYFNLRQRNFVHVQRINRILLVLRLLKSFQVSLLLAAERIIEIKLVLRTNPPAHIETWILTLMQPSSLHRFRHCLFKLFLRSVKLAVLKRRRIESSRRRNSGWLKIF